MFLCYFEVTSAIQCGGNRRSEMNEVAVTAGSPWGVAAISNAQWEGARLVDVLREIGAGWTIVPAFIFYSHRQYLN